MALSHNVGDYLSRKKVQILSRKKGNDDSPPKRDVLRLKQEKLLHRTPWVRSTLR